MSEKRKYEELLDPDYPQTAKLAKTAASSSAATATQRAQPSTSSGLTGEERIERIRAILNREFQQAIADKEQEILEIDNRIHLARKLMHRVRYAVVADYYNRKGLELPDTEAEKCVASLGIKSTAPVEQDRGPQRAIHPALRNILGKQSEVDFDKILQSRPTREAARTAISSIKEKLRTKKDEKRLQRAMKGLTNNVTIHEDSTVPKIPRHIEPRKREHKIPQLNIARGRNQTKHLIAVGNTSKYVGDERNATDGVTHKWLVYVKTKTAVPIEKILTKVRFFLHPSYRPNDIVEVWEPPFQLSRRGWGEFPIRLQLFFEPSLQQKPVQLFHNLVLDKTNCGLQTMGSETVVEIWLRTEQQNAVTKDDESSASDDGNSNDQFEDNLMDFLNRIENRTSKSLCEEEKIEPTLSIPTDTESGFAGIERHDATLRDSLKCSTSKPVCTVTSGDLSREIRKENEAAEERLAATPTLPNVLIQPIKQEPPVDIPYEPIAKPSSIVEEALKVPNKEIAKSSSLSSTGSINRTATVININPVVQSPTQGSMMGNQVKGTLVKFVPKPTVGTPGNLPQNQPQFFEKRRIKCIDKEGNVKFVEMLVKVTNFSNGQSKPAAVGLSSPGTVTMQKPVVLTKINGQTKPIILKVAPTNPIKSLTPTSSINSPTKATNLAPPAIPNPPQPINETPSLPKSLAHSTNNKVLVKNGKLCLIDPHKKPKLKQSARKQESLLKPQMSLLKPVVKNDNLINPMRNDTKTIFNHSAIATDHDYTSLVGKSPSQAKVTIYKPTNPTGSGSLLQKQKSSIVTVNSPNNSRINVIVTKLDDDDDEEEENEKVAENRAASEIRLSMKPGLTHRSIALMQKPRKDFQQELENRFEKSKMLSVRQAVEFLLKHLPLIDMRAANIDYSRAFPFVVKSQDAFDRLTTPKLKAFEWLRAKYIQQLLPKHPELIESASSFWTTKEIVIFARLHAYTPVINYKSTMKEFAAAANTTANTETDNSLKDLIKKEIKREKYDIETVTLVHDAYDWINNTRQKIDRELDVRNEIIDVDSLNEDESINWKRLTKNATQSPLKDMQGKYFHPLDASRESELKLVNDACQEIGIRLKPEEILPDVMHPSVQLVLVQSLRCFLSDLIRRASAVRFASDVTSPLVENITIRPDDIRNAILGRSQWDFLTNDSLGVAKPKESAID